MNSNSMVRVATTGLLLGMITVRLPAAELALQILHEFFPGAGPSYTTGQLLEEADGSFLSTSRTGGSPIGAGTVYRITRSGQVTVLYTFDGAPYRNPFGLTRIPSGNLYGMVSSDGQLGSQWEVFLLRTNDWSLSSTGTNFESSVAQPTFDEIRTFYGVNWGGGDYGLGMVYSLTTNGTFSQLVSFNGTNGAFSSAKLVFGKDGLLYGTTLKGGNGFVGGFTGNGTVFKITTNGELTTLAYFDTTNGAGPLAQLAFGADQRLYGTTRGGGTNGGLGTVFRVSTNGLFESLASFDGTNGGAPSFGSGLTQAKNGKFYGVTAWGTPNTNSIHGYVGTVISVTTNGVLDVVARFDGTNIVMPMAEMVLARDGNIYGVTADETLNPSLDGNTGIFFRLAQVPEISSVTYSNGFVHLNWSSFTNGVYQVQCRPTLAATNWTSISSDLIAGGDSHAFTFATTNALQGYYRVALLP